jgi:hypothetical protein
MGARNQVGIGLSYRPASLCSLATQFQTRFLESIPRPTAGLKIPTLHGIESHTPRFSLNTVSVLHIELITESGWKKCMEGEMERVTLNRITKLTWCLLITEGKGNDEAKEELFMF